MDIRTKRTRAMLVKAFEQLSEEKSLQDISVSEICELSTVRRGTFYRHFDDKYAFFRHYLTTVTDKFLHELEESKQLDDLWEYASYMHRSFATMVADMKGAQRHLLGNDITAETLDMIVSQVADGIVTRLKKHCEREGIAPAASPEFIGAYYSAGLVHTLRWWIAEGQPLSVEELERNCTAFLKGYLDFEANRADK